MTHKQFDIKELIANLPAGLDRAILSVLRFHIGKENAAGRFDILADVRRMGFSISERALRAQIALMIDDGYPIGSAAGGDGGYWLLAGWSEVKPVCAELHSKAMALLEREKAIKEAALQAFGPEPFDQPSLF